MFYLFHPLCDLFRTTYAISCFIYFTHCGSISYNLCRFLFYLSHPWHNLFIERIRTSKRAMRTMRSWYGSRCKTLVMNSFILSLFIHILQLSLVEYELFEMSPVMFTLYGESFVESINDLLKAQVVNSSVVGVLVSDQSNEPSTMYEQSHSLYHNYS